MIGYRDMTFCKHFADCKKAKGCSRPLTEKVKAAAEEWWKDCEGDPPIAVFSEKPQCHSDYDND